jgi:hypothetical protein
MWRRLVNHASRIAAVGSIAMALLWCASRVIGDPNVPTQLLMWTPTWAFVVTVLTLVGASWCLAMLGRRSLSEPEVYANDALRRPRHRAWRLVGLVVAAVLLAVTLAADWRIGNAIFGPSPAPRDRTLRVLNWNPTTVFMDAFPDVVEPIGADIAVFANPPAIVDWTRVRDQFEPSRDAVRYGRFAVISKYPVRRWGWTDLKVRGAEPVKQVMPKASWLTIDTGQAIWIELDTSAVLGRPLIVWCIDMPSEPSISRARAFTTAAATLREWKGRAMERSSIDAEAPMSEEAYAARFGGPGFPTPDLIVGDFNTPRGSPSIRTLVPKSLRSAFAQAGYGPMSTWPRATALLAIDQAFTAEWLRVTRYDVHDAQIGEHCAQIIEMTAR